MHVTAAMSLQKMSEAVSIRMNALKIMATVQIFALILSAQRCVHARLATSSILISTHVSISMNVKVFMIVLIFVSIRKELMSAIVLLALNFDLINSIVTI